MKEDSVSNDFKEKTKTNKNRKMLFGAAVIIVLVVIVYSFTSNQNNNVPLALLAQDSQENNEVALTEQDNEIDYGDKLDPSSFPVRQKYFEEAFKPNRDNYNLFEKASKKLGIPLEDVPKYFTLKSEKDIFSELPPIPEDFSEIAYLLATGRIYAIGNLSEEYFSQPEFYPNFKESGLKYWSEPDPKYWTTNGYGSYPAEQFDVLSHSGRNEFLSVVFFYTGYGVQTYQGLTIIPTSNALEYFDLTVSPDTFLLTPTFPKFSRDWAHQIVIKGKLKPDTPPGEYDIGFLIIKPPYEKKIEWASEYRNLYFDAATSIVPSAFPIRFIITVEE